MAKKKDISFTRQEKPNIKESKRVTNTLSLLFMLLKQENHPAEYYAEKLGCKVPTIKKYIRDIRASYDCEENMGFDVEYDKKNKLYKLWSYTKFPAFSPEEMEALHMAVRYFARQEGTPLKHLGRIEHILKPFITGEARNKIKKRIEFSGPETNSKLEESIDVIDEAINRKLKLVIRYNPTFQKEEIKREIVPCSLQIHDYEWYIRGFCLEDKKLKTFAVNQIVSMECKDLNKKEISLLPDEIDLNPVHRWDWDGKYTTGEKIKVRIKFTGPMSEKMKKKFRFRKEHPTQEIHMEEDNLIVSFDVKNPYNMIPWILQFGQNSEVVEPEVLKDKIHQELEQMNKLYGREK